MWLLETSGCYCSPGSPRRRKSVERGRAEEGESREQGFFYLCKPDTALNEKKKVLNSVLESLNFEKNFFLARTGWPNMLWAPLSYRIKSCWKLSVDPLALPFGCVPCDPWHQNGRAFLFCQWLVWGLHRLGFGTQAQPSPPIAIWVWCCTGISVSITVAFSSPTGASSCSLRAEMARSFLIRRI